MKNPFHLTQHGQALITLLFFVVIAVSITSAGVILLVTNSIAASKLEEGTIAYVSAESGIENAIMQLLRNQNYTGETLQVGGTSTVTVTVTQGNPITVLSVAKEGNFIRKIQVQIIYNKSVLTISSWKEVY